MLLKGYNYHAINQVLKVSNPTIWLVKTWLNSKGQGFRMVLHKIIKDEKWDELWSNLDKLIEKTLFPTPGKGVNWKEVRRRQWEVRRKKQLTF